MTATETGFLAAIFREARTFSHWQARPVPEALVESAFELACLGPTSANCQPLRLLLVRSPAAKERLLSCVSSGNYEKVRTAPITTIVAYDLEFFELLPRLYPHTDARGWFTANTALAKAVAVRTALRAHRVMAICAAPPSSRERRETLTPLDARSLTSHARVDVRIYRGMTERQPSSTNAADVMRCRGNLSTSP